MSSKPPNKKTSTVFESNCSLLGDSIVAHVGLMKCTKSPRSMQVEGFGCYQRPLFVIHPCRYVVTASNLFLMPSSGVKHAISSSRATPKDGQIDLLVNSNYDSGNNFYLTK